MMLESMEVFESMEVTGESSIVNYPLVRLAINCYVLLFLNDLFLHCLQSGLDYFCPQQLLFLIAFE